MQFRYWRVAAVAWLLIAMPAYATPNPNEIDDPTATCGKAIEKASEKFIDATADAIEKCLLAWQKCDTKEELEDADECKATLLILDSGKCAIGKLAPPFYYFGGGSSLNANALDKSAIGKALFKFVAAVHEKCPVNGSVDYAELGVAPVPPNSLALTDSLNADPTGAACNAHKRVKLTVPSRDALVTEMYSHPEGANLPIGTIAIIDPFSDCK